MVNQPDKLSHEPENVDSPGKDYAANITSGDSDQIFDEDLDSDMLVDEKGNIGAAIDYDDEDDPEDGDSEEKPFGDLSEDEPSKSAEGMKEVTLIKKE